MKADPTVSVVTTSLNSNDTIGTAFESMIEQFRPNLEYIVVDGGSTDGTQQTIEEYEPRFRSAGIAFRWSSEKDDGLYHGMNKGIERATGDLIGILNSDDFYEPGAVASMADAYRDRTSDLTIFHGQMRRVDPRGGTLRIKDCPSDVNRALAFRQMPINHPSTFVCRAVYERIGVFDTSYRVSADYDFVARALSRDVQFVRVDRVIAAMRPQGTSERPENRRIRLDEDYRVRRTHFRERRLEAIGIYLAKMLKHQASNAMSKLGGNGK